MTVPVLHLGDCLDVLRELEPDSIEACVTDPPYGFGDGKTTGFMGKEWDRDVPGADLWREVYRVLKPGAHLLSFFGTRTYHRGVCAIEDAGFAIRDSVYWIYGSGFPKSLDVSKAIDSAAGAERAVIGKNANVAVGRAAGPAVYGAGAGTWAEVRPDITAPATDAAKQWDGWGTALKPASEPIVVARKPLSGTVASNVLEHGCGGLNIDGCRVGTKPRKTGTKPTSDEPTGSGATLTGSSKNRQAEYDAQNLGRWPSNVILSYPEDEYVFRDDVTAEQRRKVWRWLSENA
jgi:site-specific DNA-methyltransferase (adenine-specific)